MTKRILLALLIIPLFLQNGHCRSSDWEAQDILSNPSFEMDSEPVESALGFDGITGYDAAYNPPTQYPTSFSEQAPAAAFHANDMLQPPMPSDFPGIEPAMGYTGSQTGFSQLPPLPPGLEYDLPPLPPGMAEQLTSLPVRNTVSAEQQAPGGTLASQPVHHNPLPPTTLTETLPPLPPGLEYDLPPLPAEIGGYLTSYPVKESAPAQTTTPQAALPPLPPGLEYDLPPLPPGMAEQLTSLPVRNTVSAEQQAAFQGELTAPPTLVQQSTLQEPVYSSRATGTVALIDTFLTNIFNYALEAKNQELNNLNIASKAADTPANTMVTNNPSAPLDPLLARELDKLGRDSVGKEYHDDLTDLIQKIKADPQNFSTNTMLQAKFDNIFERATRDEATQTNSMPPAPSISTPVPSVAAPSTNALPAAAQAFYQHETNQAAPAAMVVRADDALPVNTQEPNAQNANTDSLKEILADLKGTKYEQDAQNILAQIKTNAPPEAYDGDLKALIRKIDASAGLKPTETTPPPGFAPIPVLPLQTIPIPASAYDSQSRENRVTRAVSPR